MTPKEFRRKEKAAMDLATDKLLIELRQEFAQKYTGWAAVHLERIDWHNSALRLFYNFTINEYTQHDEAVWEQNKDQSEFLDQIIWRIKDAERLRRQYPEYCEANDYLQENRIFSYRHIAAAGAVAIQIIELERLTIMSSIIEDYRPVWEPVGEKRNIFNQEMQRIIAIRDACFTAKDGSEFHVSKDTYGGWIADPNKVSAVSWIDRTSIIFDDATVKGKSVVADKSYVMDSGSVEDNAMISETVVNGNAAVKYNALCRQSVIADHAVVTSGAKVWKSSIGGTAHIGGQCSVMLSQVRMGHIHGDAQLRGIAIGYAPEDAQLRDVTTTDGYVSIYTGVFGVKDEAVWNNMYNEALNDGISPGHRRLGEMRGFLQGAAATAGKRL